MHSRKIILLGSTGMLGHYLDLYFRHRGWDVSIPPRFDARTVTKAELGGLLGASPSSVVINCIGAIRQRKEVTDEDMYAVNAVFPHLLAEVLGGVSAHLIHITTDCVFDGSKGRYDEEDAHSASDVYGLSKSKGEPPHATVIRTSIVGSENGRKLSLLEWVKAQKDSSCVGYTNHLWNGVTCLQLAKRCEEIVRTGDFWQGVRHYFSPRSVSKYELVRAISEVYELDVDVRPDEAPKSVDRTLSTIFVPVPPPDIKDQLQEMRIFDEENGLHDRV